MLGCDSHLKKPTSSRSPASVRLQPVAGWSPQRPGWRLEAEFLEAGLDPVAFLKEIGPRGKVLHFTKRRDPKKSLRKDFLPHTIFKPTEYMHIYT